MGISCQLFGHKWNGCKCEKCGNTRNEQHNFVLSQGKCTEKCDICGQDGKTNHNWNGCKCTVCGLVRNEQHDYVLAPGTCKEKCNKCGRGGNTRHTWQNGKCTVCGTKQSIGTETSIKAVKKSNKINERFCCVCRRDNLKLYYSEPSDYDKDVISLVCVRCGTIICTDCKRKLAKHSNASRDGQLCPGCEQYTIFELTGKKDYSDILYQAEMRYGQTKKTD